MAGALLVRRNAVQVDGKVIFTTPRPLIRALSPSPSLIDELSPFQEAGHREERRWRPMANHDLICTVELGAPMKPEGCRPGTCTGLAHGFRSRSTG